MNLNVNFFSKGYNNFISPLPPLISSLCLRGSNLIRNIFFETSINSLSTCAFRSPQKIELSAYQERVEKIACRLLKVNPNKRLTFAVVDRSESNAYVDSSGNVKITTKLLEELFQLDTLFSLTSVDDFIANILGHEISHYNASHNMRSLVYTMTVCTLTYFISNLVIDLFDIAASSIPPIFLFFGQEQSGISLALCVFLLFVSFCALGFVNFSISFSWQLGLHFVKNHCIELEMQSQEFEADEKGMHLAYKAGYNPKAHLKYCQNNITKKIGTSDWMQYLHKAMGKISTHPDFSLRFAAAKRTLQDLKKL